MPAYPVEKKFPLRLVLIIAGIVVGLVAIGLVIWGVVSGARGADKQQVVDALNGSAEAAVFLDDRLTWVRNGAVRLGEVFAEGALDGIVEQVERLEEACRVICGERRIVGAGVGENELFAIVRTGLEERSTLYRRYYVENYGGFYKAFALSFREVTTRAYEQTDEIRNLIGSNDAQVAEMAKKLDGLLSGASGILTQMRALGCEIGNDNGGTCGRLNVQLSDYATLVQDASLVQRMFFLGEEVSLSEQFIGSYMTRLANWLETGAEGVVPGDGSGADETGNGSGASE
jgi:hypothetical protein